MDCTSLERTSRYLVFDLTPKTLEVTSILVSTLPSKHGSACICAYISQSLSYGSYNNRLHIRLGIYTFFFAEGDFFSDWAYIRLGIYTFFAPQARNFENPYIKCVDLDRRRRKKIWTGHIYAWAYIRFSPKTRKKFWNWAYICIYMLTDPCTATYLGRGSKNIVAEHVICSCTPQW